MTDVLGRITTNNYDANGRLTSSVDPAGNTEFTNTFDATGRVTQQADALGKISTLAYNDTTGVVTLTDATGAIQTHSYVGNVVRNTSGPTGATGIAYDADLNATGFSDETGAAWAATYDPSGNMLTRTAPAPLSYVESWTYDAKNNPLTYVDSRGNTTSWTYTATGLVASEVKPGGLTTSFTYNTDGTIATLTDPRGGVTTYTYDATGNRLSETSPLGSITTYTYDTAGRVLTVTEPRGNVAGATAAQFQQRYTYDKAGNVLTSRDALGRTTTNAYDAAQRLLSSTAPDGGITTYAYNAANEMVSSTGPNGGVTTMTYDDRGQKTSQTDPLGGTTTYAYDPAGRLTSMVSPRGNVAGSDPNQFRTSYTYDPVGRLLTTTDPAGRVTTSTYDVLGRTATQTRPDGSTSFAYDANGNILSSNQSGVGQSSATFDATNRRITSIDPRGKTTTYDYDAAGNTLGVTDPLGRKTTMTYDAAGRQTSTVDARGNVAGANPTDFQTTYTYDVAGNRTAMTDPLGNQTLTTYDRTGAVATVKNLRGQTTSYTYDTGGRVNKVTAPVVGATSFAYSTSGNMISRTDPLARVATFDYDVANRLVKKTDALGRFFTYGYDIVGNMTSVVDANANAAANPAVGSTSLTYDNLNRLTSKTFSDGTPSVGYTYDSAGRRASMTDGTGTTTYAYDGANRVASIIKGGDTFSYGYDNNGNVLTRAYPDGRTVTASFDDAGQMASVDDGAGAVMFSYDPAGNPTQTAFPGSITQTRIYDRASRVTSIANQRPTGFVSQYTYTRDGNGNPTAIDVAGPSGLIAGESQRLTFDNADRLTKACFTATTCTGANQTVYTYDKVGNRLTEKLGSAAVSTSTFDAADQLTALIGPGATTYTYSANGDLLTAGADTYTYNTARQTTAATVAGVASTFTYDGNANRTAITTAGARTDELLDTVGGLPALVAERNSTGTVLRRYTYGRGLEPLRYNDAAASTSGLYLTDGVGSVTDIVNPTGGTVATYRYNPFGTTRNTTLVGSGYTNNPLKYTGQQQDPTSNYNLRARHYNPTTGRFTQTDPMPMGSGSAFESAYVYGLNNPLVYTDPSGLRGQKSQLDTADAPDSLALVPEIGGGSCSSGSADKVVDSFVSRRKGFLAANYKNVKLLCGNDAFGYRHMFERQQHFGGVYDVAVRQAITFVLGYRFPRNDQGLLVYEQTQVCRQNGKNLFNFRIRVVVEPKKNFIVTAYIVKRENVDDPGERGNRDPRDYEPLGVQCPTTGF